LRRLGSRPRRKRLSSNLLLRAELLSYSFRSVLIAFRYGTGAFGVRGSGFGVRGSGFGVRRSAFSVWGFSVRGSAFGVRGGSGVRGLAFGIRGLAFGVQRLAFVQSGLPRRDGSPLACTARKGAARQGLQFGISSGTMDAGELRKEYTLSGLYRKDLSPDPFEQFKLWFAESIRTAGDREPNAMTLATASRSGVPSARVVLLKSFDERGVMFFTNYESRKAQQLAENPHAALNFHWPWLERQIQIEGVVQKVGREESEAYFHKRPLGSRLGAIVSKQSSVIDSRDKLEVRLLELKAQNQGANPPMPEFWGGYLLVPERFEFWQGRENRLHDRFLYTPGVDARWQIDRLAP
jgi:pyridoxamine 5'-phosphate oxidase